MAVYVDAMRTEATVAGTHAEWSHLTADTTDELNAFAARLGLRPAWLQYPGTWKEHYDVTESKRKLALKRGALPISLRQSAARLKAKRLNTPWVYEPEAPTQEALWDS